MALGLILSPLCFLYMYKYIIVIAGSPEETLNVISVDKIMLIIRNTEAAVRGRQYSPRPSIWPEKCSFEGRIDGFGLY